MMAVATKIRDRAKILQEERSKVMATEPILLELRTLLQREQSTNDRRRMHLLERLNDRNAIELEVFRIRDAIADHLAASDRADTEARASQKRLDEVLQERARNVVELYGPKRAEMEAYTTALKAIVTSREAKLKERRLEIERLRTELEESKEKEARIVRDTESLREDIARATRNGNDTGNQEDGEITSLSKRIRETIEQRSDLRQKLKQARSEYDETNEKMMSWEGKCME